MKVGIVARLGPVNAGPPAAYSVLREMVQHAERVGMDSVWLYDHLLYRWPGRPTDGIWESWTMLSAFAEATQRVDLGTIVLCTQFRNPALLAKMAITLDEVSQGRLILGLGAGWHQPEFDAFGFPFDHRASRFDEAMQIIRPLLRDGRVDFQGRYYQARECEIIPRGPRQAGPPLLLAGSGPRMLDLVARHADFGNTAWHTDVSAAEARIDKIRAACTSAGRDPSTLAMTVCLALNYPELGPPGPMPGYTVGAPDELAETLDAYSRLGVVHAILELSPFAPRTIDRVMEGVSRFRQRN